MSLLCAVQAAALVLLFALPVGSHPLAPSLLELKESLPGEFEVLWRTPVRRAAGVDLSPDGYRDLIEKGRAIKEAVQASAPPVHPDDEDLSFLYGTIFVGPPADPAHHSRNVCIFADGEVSVMPNPSVIRPPVSASNRSITSEGNGAAPDRQARTLLTSNLSMPG